MIYVENKKSPNFFCKIIRKNDLDIDQIVAACGGAYDYESICRWIFSVQTLKLVSNSQSLDSDSVQAIREFLNLNSGNVDFDKFAIQRITKTKEIKVDITPFKIFKGIFQGGSKEEQNRPSFLQVLPSIEELLGSILEKEAFQENKNSFLLMLDDLDHGFNANNPNDVANAYALIMAARTFNNEICRNGNGKVILLMRDDIVRKIETYEAGSAKAISSYAYKIKWHENSLRGESEQFNKLREFLEARLKYNYTKFGIKKQADTFIDDFFSFPFPFKSLLDKTFHRPRDFLLMLLNIGEYPYEIPIYKNRMDKILKQYKAEVIKEAKNELLAHLPSDVIDQAINVVMRQNKAAGIDYIDFQNCIRKTIPAGSAISAQYIIERLYDASVIGQIKDGKNFFKYRQGEREEEAYLHDFEPDRTILAHNIFRL